MWTTYTIVNNFRHLACIRRRCCLHTIPLGLFDTERRIHWAIDASLCYLHSCVPPFRRPPFPTLTMASKDESKASKKRAGRKRLPPLAPGPALQFVVASHPDDFKADDTMRNVRSHVMYKHRGEQGRSRSPSVKSMSGRSSSRPISATRTPSPLMRRRRTESMPGDNHFLAPRDQRCGGWEGGFYPLMPQCQLADPDRDLARRILVAATAEPDRKSVV